MISSSPQPLWKNTRKRTSTVLQMESVECGAACLGMILEYHGRIVPLEELRYECGISRDGSKALNIIKAAKRYGLEAKAYSKKLAGLYAVPLPMMLFWNFNHFVVLEGIKGNKVYLNDPTSGSTTITLDELEESFTGVVLSFVPGADFQKGGKRPSLFGMLRQRLPGVRLALAFILLASFALVLPGLIIPAFTGIFVDHILIDGNIDWFIPLLLGMALTALLRGSLTWLQQRTLLRQETKLAVTASAKFFQHVFHLPYLYFTQRYGGEIGSRVRINDFVATLLSGHLATNLLNLVTLVFFAVVMWVYDPLLTLVSIVIAMLNFLVLRLVARKRKDLSQEVLQEQGKLMGVTMGGLQRIETLRATGGENEFFIYWAGSQAKALTARRNFESWSQSTIILPTLLMAINTAVIIGVGGLRVMDGHLTIGMLVAYQSLMMSFLAPVGQLVALSALLQTAEGYMARLDDVLRHDVDPVFGGNTLTHRLHRGGCKSQIPSVSPGQRLQGKTFATKGSAFQQAQEFIEGAAPLQKGKQGGEKTSIRLSGKLTIHQLEFGYSRLESPLIKNFDLNINSGSRVALVGGSGSGKSTIIKLISSLYQPWSGEVLFDGKPVEYYPRTLFMHSVAFVDQSIFLFEGSVRDNITMWNPGITQEEVVRAAKDALIHEEIIARPGGYDSLVAEGGANFSGGQRQRIEIARALATRPGLLILDEATSALDAEIEQRIDANLRRRGCSCLIVAHRLSTIRDCDEIIVMQRGQIMERGTHEKLIALDGQYKDLIEY